MAETNQLVMTRTRRREVKKKQKQAAKKRAMRKKQIRRWSIIGLAILLPLAIVYALFFYKPSASNRGVLKAAKLEHNFGMVSVREGIKEVKIPLINIGEGVLKITGLDSSCGCTTASIVSNDGEGPRFYMAGHGKNRKDWSTVIKAGEQAFLKVYYNPAVHPKTRGAVSRIVTVYSDDPANPEQQVKIKVFQIG
jgi:hypothetical protein